MNKVSLETRQKRIIENRKRWLFAHRNKDHWNVAVELPDECWSAYVGAIKLYATQMINDNTGLYAEIVEMPTDAIINGLAASDEIKAVICAHILCEDTSVLTDSQLIKIRGLLIDWLKKARYFTPAFSNRFNRYDGIVEREIEYRYDGYVNDNRCERDCDNCQYYHIVPAYMGYNGGYPQPGEYMCELENEEIEF